MNNYEQDLFGNSNDDINEQLYFNMPEYNNLNLPPPLIEATFKFRSEEDFEEFNYLLKKYIYNGQKIFDGMQRKDKKSAWYPLLEKSSKYQYE